MKTDVCIVGAGPGGVTAAIFLAKKGIRSVLVDKATFPRDKICGDAISGKSVEVMREMDPGMIDRFSGQFEQVGSWGIKFVAPNLKELRIPFKSAFDKEKDLPPGYVSRREVFDDFLVKEALAYPEIKILEDYNANEYSRDNGGWSISGKNGEEEIDATLMLMANGAQSNFSRQAGLGKNPRHQCAGIRAYYRNVDSMDEDNFIEMHFLKDFIPGYFWIFPLPGGYANVGIGMRSDRVSAKKINLKKQLSEIIEEYPSLRERFKNAELVGHIKGFGLPLGSKRWPLSGDGYMLIGDAGHLIDPFTGEGIGNAMISGKIAANRAVRSLEEGNTSQEFLKDYDTAVYKELWNELKLSRRLQQLLDYPFLFNLVVNKASKNEALSDLISSMFEDLNVREQLKSPRFYWRLLNPFGGRSK